MSALFVIYCVVVYGVSVIVALVCDVFKRVWLDCDVLCDGVWSDGVMCLCDVCV